MIFLLNTRQTVSLKLYTMVGYRSKKKIFWISHSIVFWTMKCISSNLEECDSPIFQIWSRLIKLFIKFYSNFYSVKLATYWYFKDIIYKWILIFKYYFVFLVNKKQWKFRTYFASSKSYNLKRILINNEFLSTVNL